MNIESCFKLGYITKVHGLKGDIVAFLDVDYSEDYIELESVFVEINQQLIPFFIEDFRIKSPKNVILKFEDTASFEQASELVGKSLFLPLTMLADLEEGQFYYHDVIDYRVEDKKNGQLGIVKAFYEMPGQDLLAMEYQEKEILIPVNDDIILEADHEQKILFVELPDGLIDLYMNEGNEKEDKEE
ncbi:MAG: ribosome maturation factor RimM [Cytophagaceae bacterium]